MTLFLSFMLLFLIFNGNSLSLQTDLKKSDELKRNERINRWHTEGEPTGPKPLTQKFALGEYG